LQLSISEFHQIGNLQALKSGWKIFETISLTEKRIFKNIANSVNSEVRKSFWKNPLLIKVNFKSFLLTFCSDVNLKGSHP